MGNLTEKFEIRRRSNGKRLTDKLFDRIADAEYWLENNLYVVSDMEFSMVYVIE